MNGAVAIVGQHIAAVGPVDDLRGTFSGARHEAYPDCVLLPGLVNAHTHLELSFLRGVIPPSHFVDWVVQLIHRMPTDPEAMVSIIPPAAREGMIESLRFGVTTVGDITRQVKLSRGGLLHGPLRVVSFGEVQALGARRNLLEQRLAAAVDPSQCTETLSVGLSPHAPYTVEGPSLQRIMQAAQEHHLPVCMHLAELREESEFLSSLGGEIRRAWDAAGISAVLLDNQVPLFSAGPIHWARRWGLLQPQTNAEGPLLAHVNYADDAELDIIAASGASVAYCPRTRRFFGHEASGPHRWRAMRDRAINVCLATDSLASNPDLSVLREAQTFLTLFPEAPPDLALDMITRCAAQALHMADRIGTLEPGKLADLLAVPLPDSSFTAPDLVTRSLISQAPAPRDVWINGQRLRG
jgi:cytosine/adenosine deaminase-related metal-dependent hydrolase